MKTNSIIGIMVILWLVLMANILWIGTEGKWYVEDAEKIADLKIAEYTNQLVIVGIDKDEAQLCFFEREGDDTWRLVFQTEALIGRNGLGKKIEGDGKTPVGAFSFTHAFGIRKDPGTKFEYIQVHENHCWVDDGASNYYNQLVDTKVVKPDWNSAEQIGDYKEAYAYVLATSYNMARIPGVGSAVFLHCVSVDMESTEGCVAISEFYMEQLLKLVEPQCVLIIDDVENILGY